MRVGDLEYQVRRASTADGDFFDLSVLSQRPQTFDGMVGKTDEMYGIMLNFTEGGAIPREFAGQMFDMLCNAARLFAANSSGDLASPAGLCYRSPQVPFSEMPSAASSDDERTLAACLLDLGGCPVSHFEGLLDDPTVRGNMAVVASSHFGGEGGARSLDLGSAAKSRLEISDATLPAVRKTAKVHSSLAKAVLLARRFTKRKH